MSIERSASRQVRMIRIGVAILAFILGLALFGPAISGVSPSAQNLQQALLPPGPGEWLGTDNLGRSVLSRLSHALRLSTGLALLSVATAALPGTALGLLAAWRGGWIDRALVTLADAVLALPGLLLVLILLAVAPGAIWPFYVGLSLVLWIEYFRVIRAQARTLLASPHVEAARLFGFGWFYIVRRHLLPELLPMMLTLMTLGVATSVLALATAGYIGVGLRPPTAELGLMISEAFPYVFEAPWLIAAPVMTLLLLVAGLAFIVEASRRHR